MEKKENLGEEIEEILGVNANEEEEQNPEEENKTEKEETKEEEAFEEQKPDEEKEQSKEKIDYFDKKSTELVGSIAKLDAKIEALQNSEVSTDEFYANIDKHLTDEEQQLEFDDKPKYLQIVAKKVNEFVKSKSNQDEINKLLEEKNEHEEASKRVEGIRETLEKYPEFDYEKTQKYFHEELNQKQQLEIMKKSKSYTDVYTFTYEKYKQINKVKVPNKKPPDIPNVNKARKKAPNPKSNIADEYKSEDELISEALGL